MKSELERVFKLQSEQQWLNKVSTAEKRIEKLLALKKGIDARRAAIGEALYEDLRYSPEMVDGIIGSVHEEIELAEAHLADWMAPIEVEPSPKFQGCRARITWEARGIVLLFGPWNFPFNLVFQPLVGIIAAGNCALVKPNELTPHTSKMCADLIKDVFDESDVAVFEGGVDLANMMLELPVNHVFFTGSPAVGKIVMAAAAKHLASVTLELGGKNPVIVDRTADLADAAAKVAAYRISNHGQVCLCPENIWVPEENEQEFLERVQQTFQALYYKDGEFNAGASGKIVDERNFIRVKSYIDDAKEKGANIVYGGESHAEQMVVHPTVMTAVPENAKIMQEETFGPILNVFTYKDVADVFAQLQRDPKPLALYLFTKDDAFIERALQSTSSGGVTVNNCIMHCIEPNLPFGGVNNSGIGAYHGEFGFQELSHRRSVLLM